MLYNNFALILTVVKLFDVNVTYKKSKSNLRKKGLCKKVLFKIPVEMSLHITTYDFLSASHQSPCRSTPLALPGSSLPLSCSNTQLLYLYALAREYVYSCPVKQFSMKEDQFTLSNYICACAAVPANDRKLSSWQHRLLDFKSRFYPWSHHYDC